MNLQVVPRMPANHASRQRTASPADFVDISTVMRIKSLQLRARVIVEGFYAGLHRSPFRGFSAEFSEYREYSPGDDVRYVDWRLYARSDRYYVKQFEDETNLFCHILVDTSRSMAFGSQGVSKSDYARTLAATIAHFLHLQHDAVGLVTFDEKITEYLPPRHRPSYLQHLMAALQREPAGRSTNLARPLEQIAQNVRRRGLIILISDLLAPSVDLNKQLGYLRSRGHDVMVLRVLDPAELDFPFPEARVFLDMESGNKMYVDPQSAREEYLRRFRTHADSLRRCCSDLGIEYSVCPTTRPLELCLFELLSFRMRMGRKVSRHSPAGRSAS